MTTPIRFCLVCSFALMLACGDDDGMAMPDGSTVCTDSVQCDDGLFCTGVGACDPSNPAADEQGCVTMQVCLRRGEVCSEELDACVVCSPDQPESGWDIDGDGATSIVCGGNDCDDGDIERFPGNVEVCDAENVDEDCDPTTFGVLDRDGDGESSNLCCNVDAMEVATCGTDCNDLRDDVNATASEVCDAIDNNCNGMVDEGVLVAGFADADRDQHGDPDTTMMACPGAVGFSTENDDCDDTDPARHGAMSEICDGVDNDCDDMVDEDKTLVTWYRDEDDDGFGTADLTMVACVPPEGFSLLWTDCDDSDPAISPAADEICDAIDNDCNGLADFAFGGSFEDDDDDGAADMECGGDDCDDNNVNVFPGAPEYCDGIDNDCDAGTDDDMDLEETFYMDADGDGWGGEIALMALCEPPADHVRRTGDCADDNALIYPSRLDICDAIDNDCDLDIDEGLPERAYYNDADMDDLTGGSAVLACEAPTDFTPSTADCDDSDPAIPRTETCDGVDDDCDGVVDEGC